VALPLDWKNGEKVIVPPPKTLDEMQDRLDDTENEKIDFYLVKKELK
jgi:peroxiredoxin (alkyl hydroperoxide reductase subunit C)